MATTESPSESIQILANEPTKISVLRAANGSEGWLSIDPETPPGTSLEQQQNEKQPAETARKALSEYLHSVLTAPNLIVLAGSGASCGKVGGPSMTDLWKAATTLPDFSEVCSVVRQPADDEWIENLLSRCLMAQGFIDEKSAKMVGDFLVAAKKVIREICTQFLKNADLGAHQTFLRRMARRRLRAPRLKLFTTNYDLCFEAAAGALGLVFIDGFSFSQPRRFDPRFFGYDIVRRGKGNDEAHDFVEGVIMILKLHGSVNWDDTPQGVEQRDNPGNPCLIFPMSNKYEQSYAQPHLEMMAQFQGALREPNTCLVTVGFGFNDNHLSSQVLAAVESNPSFKLLAVDRSAKSKSELPTGAYTKLGRLIASGEVDITLLNAEFSQFSDLVPQLRALSSAEQLERSVRQIASGS